MPVPVPAAVSGFVSGSMSGSYVSGACSGNIVSGSVSGSFVPGSVSGNFVSGASSGYNQARHNDRHILSGPLPNSRSRDTTSARDAGAGR